jgi:hypothetical protein
LLTGCGARQRECVAAEVTKRIPSGGCFCLLASSATASVCLDNRIRPNKVPAAYKRSATFVWPTNCSAAPDSTVYSTAPNAVRFREARERVGLSPDEASSRMDISQPALWDIECLDDELTIYSPAKIRRFCEVLCIRPRELFGIESQATPLGVADLAALIREHCRSRAITIEQFEDSSGWRVAKSLDDPERCFLDDNSIDGIQDICRELGVDWQRFILSL